MAKMQNIDQMKSNQIYYRKRTKMVINIATAQ